MAAFGAPLIALPSSRKTAFGVMRAAAFAGDAELPAEVDVIVVGGGLNGVMSAYFLARRGVRVLLCEKAEIACEASGRAFGWVSELLLDPVKMPLSAESKRLWRDVHADVGETGFRQDGLFYFAENREEMDFYADWLASVKGAGAPDTQLLTAAGVRARFPGGVGDWAGGILAPSDGCAEPQLAASLVAGAARRAGAVIMTGCAVRTLDIAGGRVAGVVTERGRVRAPQVLFAGNAWSRLFCGNHGIDVPQLFFHMTMGRTEPLPDGPVGCGGQESWAWRRQIDGGYSLGRLRGQKVPLTRDCIQLFSRFIPAMMSEWKNVSLSLGADCFADWRRSRRWGANDVSPMERERALVPVPDRAVSEMSLKLNCRAFPAFEAARVAECWAGVIAATPDNMPIASAVGSLPGFYLVTGCSYGLTWSPALGKLMADIITGAPPTLDPTPFRHARFFDGSALRLTH
ncbi:NAD(P)/FAD-dependent oxidoreductase [Sphingosinicella sp.]|uniref:NAD(P)/FAD-dependent oxidoreductase n=1 Tax=Sphingosinicella sp. TaxID=1917971 RepID=UPI0035B24679